MSSIAPVNRIISQVENEHSFEIEGVSFFNRPKMVESELRWLLGLDRRIHLIVEHDMQVAYITALLERFSAQAHHVEVSLYGTDASSTEKYRQYASLCQAVYDTMRRVKFSDIVVFAPCTEHSRHFRNADERSSAFDQLVRYFSSVVVTQSVETEMVESHVYATGTPGSSSHP